MGLKRIIEFLTGKQAGPLISSSHNFKGNITPLEWTEYNSHTEVQKSPINGSMMTPFAFVHMCIAKINQDVWPSHYASFCFMQRQDVVTS